MAVPSTGWSRLPGCALYFFLFMSLGSVMPFVPVIWRSKGLSAETEVGLLAAVRPIALLLAGPVICSLTGKYGVQQTALYGLILLSAITRPNMLIAGGFWALAAVEIPCSVSEGPIVSLIDAAVRKAFGSGGYGTQRSWGAAGYGLATLISGFAYDAAGGSYDVLMVVYVTVLALALLAALGVPVGRTDEPAGGQDDEEPRRDRSGTSDNISVHGETELVENGRASEDEVTDTRPCVGMNAEDLEDGKSSERQDHLEQEEHRVASVLWIMFSTRQNFSFFLGVMLSGMAKGVIDTFLFIWLDELGGSHVLLGLAGVVMCCGEVPFFYVSGSFIRKIGPRNVVALSQIGYIVRLVYYSVLWDPWWVLPAELLHGLTFAAMWAATTDYAHGIAPEHLRSTMQATVAGLKRGLGYGLGAILGGVLYANLGPRRCFLASAALPVLSLLFLIVLPWISIGGGLRKQGAGSRGLEHWGANSWHEEVSAEENRINAEFENNNLDPVESRPE
ncbi:unnamed protein product [Ectocarpus sp. 8 AP-2014]